MRSIQTADSVAQTYAAIHAVDLAAVPVMSTDRYIPRKQQTALARDLLKRLKIKGVSVTTPSYSMASTVEVRVPEHRPGFEGFERWENTCYSDMPDDVPAKLWNRRRYDAAQRLEQILLAAFPKHDDRSDSMTDYFDRKWSVD